MSVAVSASAAGPASTLTSDAAGRPVRVSILLTVPDRPLATHRVESSRARASGPSPTGIAGPAFSVSGFTSWTVLSALFATQTPPGPATTAAGPMPTRTFPTTDPVGMWMRVRTFSSNPATQRSSPLAAKA